jgi:hypothetical protein
MSRLQSAVAGVQGRVNGAIDVGIALEALFLTNDEQSELGFRLKYRAAKYLRSSFEERKLIRADVGVLYALRSAAVHRGSIGAQFRERPTEDLLMLGASLASEAVKRMINDGRIPDWDKLLLE